MVYNTHTHWQTDYNNSHEHARHALITYVPSKLSGFENTPHSSILLTVILHFWPGTTSIHVIVSLLVFSWVGQLPQSNMETSYWTVRQSVYVPASQEYVTLLADWFITWRIDGGGGASKKCVWEKERKGERAVRKRERGKVDFSLGRTRELNF